MVKVRRLVSPPPRSGAVRRQSLGKNLDLAGHDRIVRTVPKYILWFIKLELTSGLSSHPLSVSPSFCVISPMLFLFLSSA